ncbi:hypothetical protein LTR56_018949 [Elasticomyces elasticus]|nr:hypothetical protein LTR56_018949 [Elasticomyces elasticus]KAK3649888.1 hypothetical protein LTR22_012764 [Elasticomyces elasticus]KAK4918161.1 hypothetical protein LTR49_014017 [Elasticomyces elasticus]KAK5757707.1 hypothetical protein LTS12_012166 [Elasticomyces elasticus]
MDFQFDNRTGPIDAQSQSAFARVGQTTTKKRTLNPPPHQTTDNQLTDYVVRIGSYSTYDSPSPTKSITTYTSPNKPLPPRPVFNALFSTPRMSKDKENWGDDSSAGETPRSPELPVADSPADTPGYAQRTEVRRLEFPIAGERLLPHERAPGEKSAGRRESWLSTQLGRARGRWGSPGGRSTGEMFGMGVEKRKKKVAVGGRGKGAAAATATAMRAKLVEKRRRGDDSEYEDSGDEDHDNERRATNNNEERRVGSPRKSSRTQHQHPSTTTSAQPPPEIKQHWMKTLYTFLESHPTIPHILTFYAQLFFNCFLLALLTYVIYTIYSTFAHDIALASQAATTEILAKMAVCAREYTTNRCAPETRVPAMEQVCEGWQRCMSRDAGAVGRAGVGARTFAEVFNSFVEAISWKTMVFTFLMVFGVFGGGNVAFGLFRRSDTVNAWGGHGGGGGQHGGQDGGQAMGGWHGQLQHSQQQQQGGWQGGYAPPTPQRQFSGGQEGQQFYGGGTPWLREIGGLEPQASQGAVMEGRDSPAKRIGW